MADNDEQTGGQSGQSGDDRQTGQQAGSDRNTGGQGGETESGGSGAQRGNQGNGTGRSEGGETPPWGDPKHFDPDKAWNLIQNLRADKDKYKQQVDEAERAKMSEQQKAEADRDSHKQRAERAETDLLRMNVGLDKGLSAAQSRRLVGATQADLEADADAMIEENGGMAGAQPSPRKPREQLRGGQNPEQEPVETDPTKLAAKIPR